MALAPSIYHLCRTSPRAFRGRGRLMKWAASRLDDGSGYFPWPMRHGYSVAIRPDEAAQDYGVASVCFLERAWESHVSELLGKALAPGDLAIDIGANIGAFACRMAGLVGPSGKVIAFEPAKSTFNQLLSSICYSGYSNVDARNLALGSSPGTLTLRVPEGISGNASAYVREGQGAVRIETVRMSTLDAELTAADRPVKLIKLDAEGAELEVLRGSLQTLKRHQPALVIEWNPETAALAQWSLDDLMNLMAGCGNYKVGLIWREGKFIACDPRSLVIEPGGYVDLFFRPGGKE